jgi:hypothetical protein
MLSPNRLLQLLVPTSSWQCASPNTSQVCSSCTPEELEQHRCPIPHTGSWPMGPL